MVVCLAVPAFAGPVDCLECHKDLTTKKVVHAAVTMGCDSCHTDLDASEVPHKFGKGKKGLSSQPPELCFGCHDKKEFTKKSEHAPVAAGSCGDCHDYHSSNNEKLLKQVGNRLCAQCHPDIEKKPHVIMRPPTGAHTLAGRRDPNRDGKPFGCISCHVPHSSQWGKLYRYEASQPSDMCKHCHEFLR